MNKTYNETLENCLSLYNNYLNLDKCKNAISKWIKFF